MKIVLQAAELLLTHNEHRDSKYEVSEAFAMI